MPGNETEMSYIIFHLIRLQTRILYRVIDGKTIQAIDNWPIAYHSAMLSIQD